MAAPRADNGGGIMGLWVLCIVFPPAREAVDDDDDVMPTVDNSKELVQTDPTIVVLALPPPPVDLSRGTPPAARPRQSSATLRVISRVQGHDARLRKEDGCLPLYFPRFRQRCGGGASWKPRSTVITRYVPFRPRPDLAKTGAYWSIEDPLSQGRKGEKRHRNSLTT
ncbi:hypothetical protein ColLi_04679 [Colletotrichum liriopes]|uniref:Uncharacterized protein n=1 Tax=Colletotrichum liriopes TaxID=708192 RepID=A0AA37GIX3_9PEZI|nr:hypothetical protein ColLi_04679 [Colletotrichum liriopes]